MGCSFDGFSSSWVDRSYIIVLLVLAWVIPLILIFISNIGIIHRTRNSDVNKLFLSKISCVSSDANGTSNRKLSRKPSIFTYDLPHIVQRVMYNIIFKVSSKIILLQTNNYFA